MPYNILSSVWTDKPNHPRTCLHNLHQLETFVHIFTRGKKTLKHQYFEVIVHVAINSTHYLKKNALYLIVNVFSTKVLIGDTTFYVSYWRRDYFLRFLLETDNPNHAKV